MSRFLAFNLLLVIAVPCLAQSGTTSESASAPDRDALLRAAVARDRGEITALETMGYSAAATSRADRLGV
jgi:hypothetical protein